jgi:hypothetical protein
VKELLGLSLLPVQLYLLDAGARSSVVSWGTMLEVRKVAGSNPDEAVNFFSIYLIIPAELWPWG